MTVPPPLLHKNLGLTSSRFCNIFHFNENKVDTSRRSPPNNPTESDIFTGPLRRIGEKVYGKVTKKKQKTNKKQKKPNKQTKQNRLKSKLEKFRVFHLAMGKSDRPFKLN